MPTYEYRCQKGHEFELFQRMSDDPVSTCPECGAQAERLLSSGAGLLFKGSGFYITDYRSDDYKKKQSTEKGGAKSSDAGGSSAPGKDAASGSSSSSPSSSSPSTSSPGSSSSGSGDAS